MIKTFYTYQWTGDSRGVGVGGVRGRMVEPGRNKGSGHSAATKWIDNNDNIVIILIISKE